MMYMIYKRIKKLREDQDLTKQNIADILHISQSAYPTYENCANTFPIEMLMCGKVCLLYTSRCV